MNNLPPGVTDADIPGNRPEDREWEEFHEWIDEVAAEHGYSPEQLKALITDGVNLDLCIGRKAGEL